MRIFIKTNFELLHKYENAPKEVIYLQNLHRHICNVELSMKVFNDDRELEFIMIKHYLNNFLEYANFEPTISCEQIGKKILKKMIDKYGNTREMQVIISEDNENGAIIGQEDL